MKKLRKIFGGMLIAVSVLWLAMKIFWPSTLLDGPEIHARLMAKEICSCVFVEQIDQSECEKIHTKLMKPSSLILNSEKKTVFSRTLFAVAKAEFVNEWEGCRSVY